MRLNPIAFNRHLEQIGQDFLWRRSFSCPCRNEHSGAALFNCPRCIGRGVFWGDPVPATAGVPNQKNTMQYAQFGQWANGDAVFTIQESSPMYDAGRFDRMTMLNSTDRFSLTLNHDGTDLLRLPVKLVDNVFWLDDDGFTMVQGGIPAVGEGGVLTWASGEPPAGKQYAIAGEKFTEYFVYQQLPSDRGEHHGARLPKRIQARLFDLFGRED